MTVVGLTSEKNGDLVVPLFLAGLGGGRCPSRSLLDFPGPDATGARPDALGLAVDDRSDALEVGVPAPVRLIIGVADVVPKDGAFATDFAYSSHRSLHSQRTSPRRPKLTEPQNLQ